jgi:sulfur-carrier protein adenylyltransferase/sulfurtransferase
MTDRYQQQIILPEIGESGQKQLTNASVLIAGAGGLGVIVASYLVAMGVGNIGICDYDNIEVSNLHRQLLFSPSDIGKSKANVLVEKLRFQNPNIIINSIEKKIDKNSVIEIANNYQIICDCTDQIISRTIINDYCAENKKVLVHGAVSDWQGYITVFHYLEDFNLNDIFDFNDYLKIQNCSVTGIISPICGIIGSYMANETIKVILNLEDVLEGKILYVNMLNNHIRKINLKKRHTKSNNLS